MLFVVRGVCCSVCVVLCCLLFAICDVCCSVMLFVHYLQSDFYCLLFDVWCFGVFGDCCLLC